MHDFYGRENLLILLFHFSLLIDGSWSVVEEKKNAFLNFLSVFSLEMHWHDICSKWAIDI